MAKITVRQADGTLVEQEQAPEVAGGGPLPGGAPLGTPAPTTPLGAKTQGANPDQAKMVGTPAQTTNALAQTVQSTQDLGQVTRQVGQPTAVPPAATETASRAKDLAGSLGTLGSYGIRIQGLISARLGQVESATTAPTVDATQVATMVAGTAHTPADATAALAAYAASGSEADLAKVQDIFGADKLAAGGLQRLYQGAPESLAALGKPAQGAVTIGQLDLAAGGMNPAQLATDLGVTPEALAAMSPDQFQQAVQDKLNTSLSSVGALQAEYKSASPARRAQILETLRGLDASGISSAEASAGHLAEEMGKAESVKFAGQDFNIQDLLKSDKVSAVIKDAATNSASMAALEASEPALAAWIKKNQGSLAEFATKATNQATDLAATQTQLKSLTASVGDKGMQALTALGLTPPSGTATSAQVAAFGTSLKANPLFQALNADPSGYLKTLIEGSADPAAAVANLQGLSAPQISALVATSKSTLANAALTSYLGLDPGAGLLTPAQATLAGRAGPQLAALGPLADSPAFRLAATSGLIQGTAGLAWAANNAAVLGRPELQDLINSGDVVTASALRNVVLHPGILSAMTAYSAERQSVDAAAAGTNPDSMQQLLFGGPVDPAKVQKMMSIAEESESPKDSTALRDLYDSNHDGNVSAADFTPEALSARLKATTAGIPTKAQILGGTGLFHDPLKELQDRIRDTGLWGKYGRAADQSTAGDAARVAANAAQATAAATLNPIGIDAADNGPIGAATLAKINAMPGSTAKNAALARYNARITKSAADAAADTAARLEAGRKAGKQVLPPIGNMVKRLRGL